MKKKLKKAIIALLLLLFFSACSNNKESIHRNDKDDVNDISLIEDSVQNNSIKKEIDENNLLYDVLKKNDFIYYTEVCVFMDSEKPPVYTFISDFGDGYLVDKPENRGETVHTRLGFLDKNLQNFTEFYDDIQVNEIHQYLSSAVDEDGQIHVLLSSGNMNIYQYENQKNTVLKTIGLEQFALPDHIQQFYAGDDRYVFVNNNEWLATDMSGNRIGGSAEEVQNILSSAYYNGMFYYAEAIFPDSKLSIHKIDCSNGSEVWETQISSYNFLTTAITIDIETEELLAYIDNSILRYGTDGTLLYQELEMIGKRSREWLINDWSRNQIKQIFKDKESLLMIVSQNTDDIHTKYALWKYEKYVGSAAEKKKIEEQNEKKIIRILMDSPKTSNSMEALAYQYMQQHPDVLIEFDFFSRSLHVNQEDYIQYINTHIYTEEADWDIILNDGLPIERYAEKGIIAALDQYSHGAYQDDKKYYSNLFDACRINGNLYYLPMGVSYYFLAIDNSYSGLGEILSKEETWTWENFLMNAYHAVNGSGSISKENNSSRTAAAYIPSLMYTYVRNTIESKEMNRETLIEILEIMKAIEKTDLYTSPDELGIFTPVLDLRFQPYSSKPDKMDLNDMDILQNDIFYQQDEALLDFMESHTPVLWPNQPASGLQFYLQSSYVVLEKSKVKPESAAFLNFVLEKNSEDSIGLIASVLRKDKEALKQLWISRGYPVNEQAEAFIDRMSQIKGTLNSVWLSDMHIYRTINEVVNEFELDVISAEEAASRIEDMLYIYINE